MATNLTADDYANNRIGIYFPGFPSSLTGQCVSLTKWYLGEMCGVANWQDARGNAKDFGDTLVNQGLAYPVPEANRTRGDIVVWKQDGGGYGHIGVLLSGDRVFEENVGLKGAPSASYGGNVVYASRIDPLYASWRTGGATFYRVRGYSEVDPNKATRAQVIADYIEILGRDPSGVDEGGISHYMAYSNAQVRADLLASNERKVVVANQAAAATAAAQAQIDAANAAKALADKLAADAAKAAADKVAADVEAARLAEEARQKALQDAADAQALADAQLADAKAKADAEALDASDHGFIMRLKDLLTIIIGFFTNLKGK